MAEDNSAAITNVFVVMLENHSFDNIFAMSGIPGIRAATTAESNTYAPLSGLPPTTYHVKDGAPPSMTTDPGHEFPDVLQQLCGVGPASAYKGGIYPPIDLSGFASSYATSTSEDTGTPAQEHVGDIMACFHTPAQLPVINQLAREFAICDAWHSSMPGPTWPNRFFVHGASSAGMTISPSMDDEIEWETWHGFIYGKGSIYDRLKEKGHHWRLYQDKDNQFSDDPSGPEFGGWISQVAAIKGIELWDVHSLKKFAHDLNALEHGKPAYHKYRYTFIEPNFGRSFFAPQNGFPGPTYRGGSSQHPEDDPSGGEGLLKFVYETLRASPVWDTSLLIILYDEHGGFYDSVKPPCAVAPGDPIPKHEVKLNKYKFDFQRYGVRVPAVIVSPLIEQGIVDPTLYDHTSALATLERMLGLDALTARDADANDLRHLLTRTTPRDCPRTLVEPLKYPLPLQPAASLAAASESSLPKAGNAIGFLHVLLKAELALCGDDPALRAAAVAAFKALTTQSQACAYVARIKARIDEKIAVLQAP
jgi:phospholipase C